MKLKIVTQTDNIEKGGVMDDCAPATLMAAANHLTGSTLTSTDGIAVLTKVGRKDIEGKPTPTSLAQLVKAAPLVGLKARYAKSWEDVVAAMKAGAVIGINVQQPVGYPATVKMSAWHEKWKKWWWIKQKQPNRSYGHMTCAAALDSDAQWADPTMSGKGSEAYAVPVSLADLKKIASSKGDAPHKRCLVFTAAKPKTVTAKDSSVVELRNDSPTPIVQRSQQIRRETARPTIKPVPAKSKRSISPEALALFAQDTASLGMAAFAATKGVRGLNRVAEFLKYVAANSKLDEMALDAMRTFLTVSISVALGLGIPILDISSGDFRTILSAGLASALQVVVKALDPNDSSYGVTRTK